MGEVPAWKSLIMMIGEYSVSYALCLMILELAGQCSISVPTGQQLLFSERKNFNEKNLARSKKEKIWIPQSFWTGPM